MNFESNNFGNAVAQHETTGFEQSTHIHIKRTHMFHRYVYIIYTCTHTLRHSWSRTNTHTHISPQPPSVHSMDDENHLLARVFGVKVCVCARYTQAHPKCASVCVCDSKPWHKLLALIERAHTMLVGRSNAVHIRSTSRAHQKLALKLLSHKIFVKNKNK